MELNTPNELKITQIPIDKIAPAAYNPRSIGSAEFEGLKESLKKFGMPQPLIVNKRTGVLVGGHQRLKAASALGWQTVPVVEVDLSLAEEKALNVTLNNQKISGHFTEGLASLLDEIRDELGDDFMRDLKMDEIEVPPMPHEESAEEQERADNVPDVAQNEMGVQLGDVYLLGEHRLMCGDSTDAQTVEKLMNGEKADIVYCDPPYGMDLDTDYKNMGKNWVSDLTGQTTSKKYQKIIGDNVEFDPKGLLELFSYCKEILLWGGDHFYNRLPAKGAWIIWDKRRSDNFEVKETVDNIFGSHFEVCWSKNNHRREIIRHYRVFGATEGVSGEVPSGKNNTPVAFHPTQKPVVLHEKVFLRIKGITVVDLFGGSGSTLIACEKTKRKCFMMELDPHYCSVIIKRWEAFTNRKAEKVS